MGWDETNAFCFCFEWIGQFIVECNNEVIDFEEQDVEIYY